MSDDLSLFYKFAIYTGIALQKIRCPKQFFTRAKKYSFFFRYISLILEHSDKMCWRDGNRFVIVRFSYPFNLNKSNYYWLTSYLESIDEIHFKKDGRSLYANVRNLTFQVPNLKAVIVLKETFIEKEYAFFDVKDSVVIDIGAYVGDTAIFFAKEGARKIVAYEPNPTCAQLATKNVILNGYSEKIVVENSAVGAEDGFLELNDDFKVSSKKFRVKKVSINSLLDQMGSIDLLKMDCEGAEWEIIDKMIANSLFEKINKIIMEVHGTNKNIDMKKVLKDADFDIKKIVNYGKDLMLIVASKK